MIFPTERPAPSFTIASIIAPGLIGALSYPVCLYYLRDSDPTGEGGFFVVFALMALMTFAVAAGSLVGLALAIVAHLRKEKWLPIRILSLIVNTLFVFLGGYTFYSLPRDRSSAEDSIDERRLLIFEVSEERAPLFKSKI
jgi:MFS family permease